MFNVDRSSRTSGNYTTTNICNFHELSTVFPDILNIIIKTNKNIV